MRIYQPKQWGEDWPVELSRKLQVWELTEDYIAEGVCYPICGDYLNRLQAQNVKRKHPSNGAKA